MKQDVGLILLGVTSSFGVWSALNTSPTGLVQFGIDRPDITYSGMNTALALILGLSAGIGLLYGKKGYAAAGGTAVSGIALWLWYDRLIKQETV